MAKARKKTKPRNRAAQDITLINLRSLRRDLGFVNSRIDSAITFFEEMGKAVSDRVKRLEQANPIRKLSK